MRGKIFGASVPTMGHEEAPASGITVWQANVEAPKRRASLPDAPGKNANPSRFY